MIGLFDSGLGGLSVLRALLVRAPKADVVYFGDTANAPYGPKSRDELIELTAAGFDRLIKAGATEIVSACNSVSVSLVLPVYDALGIEPVYIAPRIVSAALPQTPHEHAVATHAALLRMRKDLRVIEMVGPTAAHLAALRKKRVLVVATEATVRSGMYQEALRLFGIQTTMLPIPELAGLIEAGADEEVLYACVRDSFARLPRRDFDTLVLGCTHYPLARAAFERILAEHKLDASIVDPADPVAERVAKQFATEGSGRIRFSISKESAPFRAQVAKLLIGRDYTIEVA